MRSAFSSLLLIGIIVAAISAYPFIVSPRPPNQSTSIVINKAINRMYLYENGRLVGRYTVATGKEVSLTPEGDLVIVVKEASDQGLG